MAAHGPGTSVPSVSWWAGRGQWPLAVMLLKGTHGLALGRGQRQNVKANVY